MSKYQLTEIQEKAVASKKPFLFMSPGSGKTITAMHIYKQKKEAGIVDKLFVCTTKAQRDISIKMKEDWYKEFAIVFGYEPKVVELTKKNYMDVFYDDTIDMILNNHHYSKLETVYNGGIDLSRVMLILDEVHFLKNPGEISKKYGKKTLTGKAGFYAAKIAQRSGAFLGLTGTPSSVSWYDYANYFIMLNIISDTAEFKRNFCNIGPKQVTKDRVVQNQILSFKNIEGLKRGISRIGYRTGDVEKYTGIDIYTNHIDFMPDRKALAKFKKTLTYETYAGDIKDALNRPQQHYCSLMIASGMNKETSAKAKHVFDLIVEHKIGPTVLFYNYTEEYDNIVRTFKHYESVKKIKYKTINGKLKELDFTDDIADIILVQYQAGAEGLNMKDYTNTIIFSPNRSYKSYKQALGRNNRMNQTKDITRYVLLCTVEQMIYDKLMQGVDYDYTDNRTFRMYWESL